MKDLKWTCKYIKRFFFILILYFQHFASASSCPQNMVENKKPPVEFKPFPMVNPKTGEKVPPQEIIEFFDQNGKAHKIKVIDFFNEINAFERIINTWGYSLRDPEGSYELNSAYICTKVSDAQKEALLKSIKSFSINKMLSYDEWKQKIQDTWKVYKEMIPNLSDISKYSDAGKVDEFLTTVPTFNFSTPTLKRTELKFFRKEKKWAFENGEKNKFYIHGYAEYKVHASKIEVDADARAGLVGVVFNSPEVKIIYAEANARSPGSQEGKLNANVVFLGQSVYSLDDPFISEKLKPFNYHKELYKNEVKYEYPTRIPIGPINIRIAVGIRGQTKIHWGVDIVPLQISAYVQHYAGLDVYANAALDVYIGGVGVEARLILVSKDTKIQGSAIAEFDEHLKLKLSLVGTTSFNALSGDFSLIYYFYSPSYEFWNGFIIRHEYRNKIWGYEGYKREGTIFDFSAELTPFGYKAKGDLSVDDVAEQLDIDRRLKRAEQIAKLELNAQSNFQKAMLFISNDLKSDNNIKLINSSGLISYSSKSIDNAYDLYLNELLKWTVNGEEI